MQQRREHRDEIVDLAARDPLRQRLEHGVDRRAGGVGVQPGPIRHPLDEDVGGDELEEPPLGLRDPRREVLRELGRQVAHLAAPHDSPERGDKAAAILALIGVINLPIIKFSVDWWNTLHQPDSILRPGGPSIDVSMLVPLLVMWAAFLCYFTAVHILRTRAELTARKIRNLRLSADPPG